MGWIRKIILFLFLFIPGITAAGISVPIALDPFLKDRHLQNVPSHLLSLKEFLHLGESNEKEVEVYLSRNNISAAKLHRALLKQNNYELKALLYSFHTPDALDSNGLSPLQYAAISGNEAAVSLLLEFGAAIGYHSPEGMSAADMAAYAGSLEIIRVFDEWRGEPDRDASVIDYAVRSGNRNLVEYLYEQGLRPHGSVLNELPTISVCEYLTSKSIVTSEEKNPLYAAIVKGSREHIRYFADNTKYLMEKKYAPLAAAAAANDTETVGLLLERKADTRDRCYGKTALYYAALNRNIEMTLSLLKANADPNSDDFPLSAALLAGSAGVYGVLVEHGAKTGYVKRRNLQLDAAAGGNAELFSSTLNSGYSLAERDNEGNSALHRAAFGGNHDIIRVILTKKYPVTAVNGSGDTALHVAAFNGNSSVVRLLLNLRESKKLINAKNRSGETPLLSAVKGRADEKTIQLLMQYGAKRSDVNSKKQNIFHIAVLKNPKVIPFLFKYSRELNVKDLYGETPLIYAIRESGNDDFKTVDRLVQYGARIGFTSKEGKHEWDMALDKTDSLKKKIYFPVSLLIRLGAPVNARDRDGRSLLMRAVINGRYDDAMFLLAHKADTGMTDRESFTALSHALFSDDELMMKLVFEAHFRRTIDRNDEFNWIIRESRERPLARNDLFPNLKDGNVLRADTVFRSSKAAAYFYSLERNAFSDLLTRETTTKSILPVCKSITLKGFDIDTKTSDGLTVLMRSAAAGDYASVKSIIMMKADCNIRDRNGWTALIHALIGGKSSVSRLLVESGADINVMTKDGINPLLAAQAAEHRVMIDYIAAKGGSIQDCRVNVETVRFMISLEHVMQQRSIYKVDLNYRDTAGRTPLLKAAEKGAADAMSFLINAGADVSAKSETGQTLILYALQSGSRSCINHAVKSGSDANAANSTGTTPLRLSIEQHLFDVIPQLINSGADPTHKNAEGKSILFMLIEQKSYPTSLINYLVEKGVNPDDPDRSGHTPLMVAAAKGNYRSASLLLGAGADLKRRNREGKSAFDYAVDARSTELIRMFIERGERPTAKAFSVLGDEALDLNRFSDAARYYRKALAADLSINVYNNLGKAHLHMRDYSTAEKCFRVALNKKPDDPNTYYNMACYLSLINRRDDAIYWLSLALSKGYSNYNSLYTENSLTKIRNTDAFAKLMNKNQKN